MNDQAEIIELKRHLDTAFERIGHVDSDNPELQSDLARYLCILVSGYLEKAVAALLLKHAKQSGGPTLQRFVGETTKRPMNLNAQRLQELLGSFDPDWRSKLKSFLVDERKAAVNSVASLRNRIAHGETVGVTYQQISGYYAQVWKVVDKISELCCIPD
uniref:RiboL-PSP-HEPN domain-containing protein n=1 Tax=Candidatus Kentrum sp. TUN TaxID=2126343 RepID=A0A450ZJU2_9GAMM|nr:MAG: hypothetical protein BECKTUN1418E_GA0071001_10068 [Candidatus Kentron sp. TUN]VFK54034.1 MAG: hypothetical protein BECKTUN1418F_GA0071002_103617 [Candidatus Kentron sp. TUN]VFK60102.1 MAG: hypothetical protein BECKTUN1418D_GA0071000_11163 [Candidatus Kentron sp. TUN]